MTEPHSASSLVSAAWLEAHRHDPNVRLIEIAGLGQEDMAAYKSGHVPGAVCWKWKDMLWDSRMRDFPDPDEFARRMGEAGIGNDTTVVIYGEDMQFGVYAWWALHYCGHRNVRLLDGARAGWQADGRALTQAVPEPVAAVRYAPTQRQEQMRVLRDEVLAAVRTGSAAILDARSPEEYSGQRVGGPGGPDVGAVRPGRIPGARHLHFLDLLDAHKRFKSPDQLEVLVRARKLAPGDRIIAYCRMSHRATVIYFVLTELLGFDKVEVYDGSWTEWGNLVGAPIERGETV